MKKLFSLLLITLLVIGSGAMAYAEDFEGPSGLQVTYDGSKLTGNLDMTDALSELQPGDTVTITITTNNKADGETDWWMKNSIIDSFEDSSDASGGAYSYELSYDGEVLFSNGIFGGENTTNGEGLNKVSSALEDFFFLATMTNGDTGKVVLKVSLDGETQGNVYQDTVADLDFTFAVEPRETETVIIHVKTGDTTVILPYIITGIVGLILLLGVLIFGRKKVKE